MNTLKYFQPKQIVAWSLVVMFSCLQIIPVGMAATAPADELQLRSVPVSVAASSVPEVVEKPAPEPRELATFMDSTAFLANSSPLSRATVEPESVPTAPGKLEDTEPMPYPVPLSAPGKMEDTEPMTYPAPSESENPNPTVSHAAGESTSLPGNINPQTNMPYPVLSKNEGDKIETPKLADQPISIAEKPPVVRAYEGKVITDPATGIELSVSIDEHSIATVKWGDQEYKGFFDPRTNSLILVTKDDAVWTLQFGKNEQGGLYLQTFQNRNWSANAYSEETYTYNPQSQLVRKEWVTENHYDYGILNSKELIAICYDCGGYYGNYRSGGTIDYVQINGKTLVSHEKMWNENGKIIQYEEVTFQPQGAQSLMPYYPSGRNETDNWYSYDNQGNLLAKSWNSTNGYGGSGFGQEQYVQINGKTLLSVSRVWQYERNDVVVYEPNTSQIAEAQPVSIAWRYYGNTYHNEDYYNYDVQGNLLARVTAWESYDYNNNHQTGGYYWIRNTENNTWSQASAEGINNLAIHSWADYGIIDAAAKSKTVWVCANGEQYNYTHYVVYTRDANGAMTAKAVYQYSDNSMSIVQGEPDVLSGETNDIKMMNGQKVNGYAVFYEEYWHLGENGKMVSEGYRLVFHDQMTWAATAVDFPKQNTVELNGDLFKITVDQDGKLILDKVNVLPPAVQAYVTALKQLLGGAFQVSAALNIEWCTDSIPANCGGSSYRVSITLNDEIKAQVRVGQLTSSSFNISEKGEIDAKSFLASYAGIGKVDGQLLYEGMGALLNSTVCNGEGCTGRFITPENILSAMTAVTVTQVDDNGAIHFGYEGKNYKVFRDEQGNAKFEEDILPPAVQAYVSALKGQLGARFSVAAALQEDGTYLVQVGLVNACPKGAACAQIALGSFSSLEFGLNADGTLKEDSVAVHYNGIEVDGKLLFAALMQLPYMDGRSPAQPVDPSEPGRLALAQMTQIFVRQADEKGMIRFYLEGKNYKAFRDEQGNVKLEEDLPPAVQGFVDQLREQLKGYRVNWELKYGRYIVSVGKEASIHADMQLLNLSFALSAEGVVDPSTVRATYGNSACDGEKCLSFIGTAVEVDGPLLFEGVRELLNRQSTICNGELCTARIISDQETLVTMAALTVGQVEENAAIHFTLEGKNYKVYRDEQGNVKLEEDLPPVVQAVRAAVLTGLINTFGFSKETMDQLIKDGKIVIKVDAENLTATVTIDPSVKFDASVDRAGLANLLGLGKLPGQITYQLGSFVMPMGVMCPADGPCPQAQPTYFLKDGHFSIGNLNYDLSYESENEKTYLLGGDNQLRSVVVSEGPACEGKICPSNATRLIEALTFSYAPDGSGKVEIHHLDTPQDGVVTRIVSFGQMIDRVAHIQSIVDLDVNGDVVANNGFVYHVAVPDCAARADGPTDCGPGFVTLDRIDRTDANGKPLSQITVQGNSALITLPDGSSKEVAYASMEQLLDLARQFEKENKIPSSVQAFVDALQKQVGVGYAVSAVLVNGQYHVSIALNDKIEMPVRVGQLASLSFNLVGDLLWNERIKATEADAAILEELGGGSLNHLTHVKTYSSDASGNPILKGESWQLDVKGDGSVIRVKAFEVVNGQLTERITYSEQVKATAAYSATRNELGSGSLDNLTNMFSYKSAFNTLQALTSEVWQLDLHGVDSIQASYNGIPSVDAKLLFEALQQLPYKDGLSLQQWADPLESGLLALARMTRIGVNKADEKGVIHFLLEGKNYKAYRDAQGNVKLEEESTLVPHAEQVPVTGTPEELNILNSEFGADVSKLGNFTHVKIYDQDPADGVVKLVREEWHLDAKGDGSEIWTKSTNVLTGIVNYSKQVKNPGVVLFAAPAANPTPAPAAADRSVLERIFPGNAAAQQLLLDGMKLLKPEASEEELLGMMERVAAFGGEAGSAILFTFEEKWYKLSRNAEGVAVLESFDIEQAASSEPSQLPSLGGASLGGEENSGTVNESPATLAAARSFWGNYNFRRMNRARRMFSAANSLRPVSSSLSDPLYLTGDQGSGTTPLFGFEKASLLYSKLLTELTE